MKLIVFCFAICNWVSILSAQSVIFYQIGRDSIYEDALISEIDSYSTFLEFGEMEINISDSSSVYVQLRKVLYRFDAKELNSFDENSRLSENFMENKLIMCYNYKDRFHSSFEYEGIEKVMYIKYKGYLMILYNYRISKYGDIGFDTGDKELDFVFKEPFDLIKIYLSEKKE